MYSSDVVSLEFLVADLRCGRCKQCKARIGTVCGLYLIVTHWHEGGDRAAAFALKSRCHLTQDYQPQLNAAPAIGHFSLSPLGGTHTTFAKFVLECPVQQSTSPTTLSTPSPTHTAKMENDKGELVDLLVSPDPSTRCAICER